MRFRPQILLVVFSNVFLAGYFTLQKQGISDTLELIEKESEALKNSQRVIYTSLRNASRNNVQVLNDLEKNYGIIKEITEFTRGNYIRIKGVHEKDGEILEDKVLELAEYMKVNLRPEDIERVNRIGVKKESIPRVIVVLLSNFKFKVKLLQKAASALQNTPFVLQDDLPNYIMPAALLPVKKRSFSQGCGYIIEISKPMVNAKGKKMFGAWLRDPIPSPDGIRDSYIWTLPHFYQNNIIEEYANLHELYHRRSRTIYKLPYEWGGTGHVVYNGSLYFVKYNTSAVIRYNFSTRNVTSEKHLVGAAFGNVAPYQWSGSTDIDLSVDETGMWAIYATMDNTLDIVLSKINPETLDILQTWRTNWRKQWSGNAFMACGILYVLKKYDEQETSLSYIYDTVTKRYKRVQIPFVNKYEWNTMLEYNFRDKLLYAWDRGYLVTYNVTMSSDPV